MGKFQNVDEAREYFKGDRFAMVNGMTIDELTDGGCICSMAIREDHRNAIGGVMGGVLFTLADFAFAVAANQNHHPTVALDVNINFLSASKGTRLIAHTECVKDGKTTCVYQTEIMDDLGRKVALVTGTGYKL
ncbi:MAG: PaaI family thioesterase [Clostridia bacterium]|nr:PaaI family thioesterase [Clostridia bacterium]